MFSKTIIQSILILNDRTIVVCVDSLFAIKINHIFICTTCIRSMIFTTTSIINTVKIMGLMFSQFLFYLYLSYYFISHPYYFAVLITINHFYLFDIIVNHLTILIICIICTKLKHIANELSIMVCQP